MKRVIFFTVILLTLSSCEYFQYEAENDSTSDKLTGKFISDNFPGKSSGEMTFDSKGNLWIESSEVDTSIHLSPLSCSIPLKHYLSKFSTDSFEVVDSNFIGGGRFTIDKNDNLWFQSLYKLYRFNGKKYDVIYDQSTGERSFNWISLDQNNNVWACGFGTPLVKIIQDPELKIVSITNSVISPIGIASSTAACFDKDNNLWIVLWSNNSIGKLTSDGKWTYYNQSNSSIPNQGFFCITSDKSGNIWAGTGTLENSTKNLFMFDGTSWRQVVPKDEKGNRIYGTVIQLYNDGNKIWIVSEVAANSTFDSNYLVTFDGENWNRVYEAPVKDGIYKIVFDFLHNRVLIGTLNSGIIQVGLK